ncbi:MAG: aspartate ammonia-lyase [Candidatus Kapabacteria bacterium]|nr:aspartate ammonia-lyase [Ignavibacteriota bacterium]MCW5885302.1 aspartate ammonia-lyase [Candidatus Kapabacteria bacterium]
MNASEILEFLSGVQLFEGLSNTELESIALICNFKTYRINQYLFEENQPRLNLFLLINGRVELVKRNPFGKEKLFRVFERFDFMSEGALMDEDNPHSTSAKVVEDSELLVISRENFNELFKANYHLAVKILATVSRVISRRMSITTSQVVGAQAQYISGKTRHEHDLLGDREVPYEFYYGIQTLRGLENFNITGIAISHYPHLIRSLAQVKMAAAKANNKLGLLGNDISDAIIKACEEIINGRFHANFVVDMIQGGAGTSTNMNANEVIANRALEIMGYTRGEYEKCHPNNHVNMSQSTNDVYPTAIKLSMIYENEDMIVVLKELINSFRNKAIEFADVIKMGRTQLQDAVPMTLGQEFEAYAVTLEEEIQRLKENSKLFFEINMGGTAIGTGINADPEYSQICTDYLCEITELPFTLASNLVEATQDTGAFVIFSSAVKRLAVKLSKICNDLRLLSSGPRTGFGEINLPPMQPGSSIMPGKVNPVIPEVVNQIAFKVIGNDLTVTLAAEGGQLQLNVMEPVITQSILESIEMLKNGMMTLKYRCIDGITANVEHCRNMVLNSIGLVTALNPILGYEACTKVAKRASEENRGVYELVLEMNLLTKEELEEALKPENMIKPVQILKKF